MVTWWKRIIYSKLTKGLLALGFGIMACIFCYSLLGMNTLPESVKSYADTEEFRQAFIQKAGYLRDWIVRYDENTIFTEVTDEQIESYIKKDGRGLTRKQAVQGIVNDRNSYYNMIKNELENKNKNLEYIAIDTEKNRQITNMGSNKSAMAIINELCNRKTYLIGNGYYILQANYGMDGHDSYYNGHYFTDDNYYAGENFSGQDNYRIYIALKDTLAEGDEFYTGYLNFKAKQQKNQNIFKYLFLSIGVSILLMFAWIIVTGRRCTDDAIHMKAFDKVPFEIQAVLFVIDFIIFILALGVLAELMDIHSVFNISPQIFDLNLLKTGIFCCVIITYIASVLYILSSWIRHFKNNSMTDHIWCIKTGKSIYQHIFGERNLALTIITFVSINICVNVLAIRIAARTGISNIIIYMLSAAWNILWGIILLKIALEYKSLLKGAKDIAAGKLDTKVQLGRTVPMLTNLAEAINSIGTGMEKAVDASIKSERLKTELITNVSHDLKTPLTSIISYIDLLKGENIEDVKAREYIDILDERSHRLKLLVEDLVEASKVVTGNVKAQLETLRFDELTGQAVGEYMDRIEMSGLSIVMDQMEEVYITGDGRHMWRVIENLLSNVCKYAMPHTRVYINVETQGEFGCLTIKNISREPLNINADELTERFVRGDSSRTTEGSGLGLAIAQSLVTLQRGHLTINIDGDLFKVEVKMPVAVPAMVKLDKETNE